MRNKFDPRSHIGGVREYESRPEDSDHDEDDNSGIPFESIIVGKHYDIKDSSGRWCEGQILKIDTDMLQIFVGYLYWDSRFDEWISKPELNVARLNSHTYFVGGELKTGQRIEFRDEKGSWVEAIVIDTLDTQVKIHCRGYHSRHDDWVDRQSDRIRPFRKPRTNSGGPAGRKEGKVWRVPVPSSGAISEHNKENLGIKRPWNDDDTVFSGQSSNANNSRQNSSRAMMVSPTESVSGNLTDDERKRKIVAGAVNYIKYENALHAQKLKVVPVLGDGNCLFRAVAHQMYGNEDLHAVVREKVMDYMQVESDFFSQFVEGGKDMFPYYLNAKRGNACWGDDPEIEAICELYQRPAEIWAFDAVKGANKLRTFHENQLTHSSSSPRLNNNNSNINGDGRDGAVCCMRLSYYGGGHYDSIVSLDNNINDREYVDEGRQSNNDDNNNRYYQAVQFPLQGVTPGEFEDSIISKAIDRVSSGRSRPHSRGNINNSSNAASNAVRQRNSSEDSHNSQQQQQFDDTMDIALEASRRQALESDYDDLETCLALSMKEAENNSPDNSSSSFAMNVSNSAKMNASDGADLIAIQGDIFKSIKEQSEMEYLEKAILSSLADETKHNQSNSNINNSVESGNGAATTEEELLEQVKKASEREYMANSQKSTHNAMQLSSMSEDEALELALRQSLEEDKNKSRAVNNNRSQQTRYSEGDISLFQLEEDELQQALNASMRSNSQSTSNYTANSSNNSKSGGGGGLFYATAGGNLEEMDEDLVKAIEESLKK